MVLVIWVLIAVVLTVIEAFTAGFLALWFAIGAAITAIVVAFFPEIAITAQIGIFTVSSCILFIITRKRIQKSVDKNCSQPVYSILGKTAIVTKEIDSIKGTGQININGDIWSAKCKESDILIPINTKVEVVEIEGVKAVVRLLDTQTEKI